MFLHKTVLASCHIINSPQAVPLAASILKSYQPYKKEVEVLLKDFYLNETPLEAAESILQCNPDSIGFSMYIWNRNFLIETASIIKKTNKDIPIYAGGAEITASALSLVGNNNFDFLIRGEGELPFVNLLNFFIGKNNSKPNKLLDMNYLKDLESIPSPFLNSNIDPSDWDGLLWELSRGCPYNCSFCSESRGVEGIRYYNEERIREELILFEEKNVEQIFVLDPTFNIDKKRALKIINLIKEYSPAIHFTFEIRAELLDKELAESFAELHCSLQIGLQSSQPAVLKNVNRSINPGQFSEKISLLNTYGAVFGLDLIYGLPGDTLSGFFKSLDYALYQIPNHLDIFRLSIFPGTVLFDQADRFNLKFEKDVPYSVISSPGYTEKELDESEKIALAVNIFYNKGKAAGWLLSVIDILDISPSEFFIEFNKFLDDHSNFETPYKLQNNFLKYIFSHRDKKNYLPIAMDLCQFHFLYSEALYAGYSQKASTKTITLDIEEKFHREPGLQWGTFFFDITFLAEYGMIDIKNFMENNNAEKSYAIIFNNGNEIETISIEKYLYEIVDKINGCNTLSEILNQLGINIKDAEEFIGFLIKMNLIVPGTPGTTKFI